MSSSSEAKLAERSGNERKNRDVLFDNSDNTNTNNRQQQQRQQQRQRNRRRNNNNNNNNTTTTKKSTASEAQSIQKSLLRTQSLLRNELQRVSHVRQAIDEDGKILQSTMEEHKSFDTKNASKALTSLQRAQQHEQRVLMVSVLFFIFVSFNILWSRVIIKFDFITPFLWTNTNNNNNNNNDEL